MSVVAWWCIPSKGVLGPDGKLGPDVADELGGHVLRGMLGQEGGETVERFIEREAGDVREQQISFLDRRHR